MKKLLLLAIAHLVPASVFAQNSPQYCGTKYVTGWETPEFETARIPGDNSAKSTTVYSIPVVFHVIHQGGPENVSDSLVMVALAKLNAEYANQAPYNDPDGVDIGIQFCLAIQDSAGDPTTGIIHHFDPATNFNTYITNNSLQPGYSVDSQIASIYHWPTDKYLNIYTVQAMVGNSGSTATFPAMHGNFRDGIFMIHNFLLQSNVPHETGHYLGLYHPFDGSCANNDCTNDNDKVCDTPPDGSGMYNQQTCIENTCSSDEADASLNNPFRSTTLGGLGDQDDDTKNFMDISTCQSKFTAGQKTRMQATITTIRSSLSTSQGCQFPTSAASVTKNELSIYPNPVTDNINILGADNSIATLFNTIGQQVIKNNITSDKYIMNTTSLQAGIYMLVVVNKDGNETVMRIVKQ